MRAELAAAHTAANCAKLPGVRRSELKRTEQDIAAKLEANRKRLADAQVSVERFQSYVVSQETKLASVREDINSRRR